MNGIMIRNEYGERVCDAYWDPVAKDVIFETRYRGLSRRIRLKDIIKQLYYYKLLK